MMFQRLTLFAFFILLLASCKQQETEATCPDLGGHYLQCGELFDTITQETTKDDVTTYSLHSNFDGDIRTMSFVADGNTHALVWPGDDTGRVAHYTGTCEGGTLTVDMYETEISDEIAYKNTLRVTLTSQKKGGNLAATMQNIVEITALAAEGEEDEDENEEDEEESATQREESPVRRMTCIRQ